MGLSFPPPGLTGSFPPGVGVVLGPDGLLFPLPVTPSPLSEPLLGPDGLLLEESLLTPEGILAVGLFISVGLFAPGALPGFAVEFKYAPGFPLPEPLPPKLLVAPFPAASAPNLT